LCGGVAIALCLTALGVASALFGYSYTLSVKPAADQVARALVSALEQSEAKTTVSGTMSLAPNAVVKLANAQTVKLQEGSTVKLDPSSSVRVLGDFKMPQPSKRQLQADTTSGSHELPFTSYVVFTDVSLGQGLVESGWLYDLSDTARPQFQQCFYREAVDEGLVGKIMIALNGSPQRPSPLVKLPFNFDEALAKCSWFSGY